MDFLKFAASLADDHKHTPHDGDIDEFAAQSKKAVPADVRMFSGCQDQQTSADVSNVASFGLPSHVGPGGAGGACTNALMACLHEKPNQTWVELLNNMRKVLKHKGYSQIPELSCSRQLDLNTRFDISQNDSGRKRALLIGINYVGQKGELRGCVNDVETMKRHIEKDGYEDIKVLADVKSASHVSPTKENIMEAFDWLIEGAKSGDSLFFHYSGHGGRMRDQDGDEEDGYDETLIPVDYQRAGQIRDDDVFKALVAPLPAGVQLTAVLDCCHSGSVLDLPFIVKGSDAAMADYESGGGAPSLSPNPSFNMEKVIKVAKACFVAYQKSGGDLKATAGAAIGEAFGFKLPF